MPLITLQAKGQMTVPAPIREALGIDQGAQLFIMQTGPCAFECRVLPKPLSVNELIARFSSPDPVPSPRELQEIVREGILAEACAEDGWVDDGSKESTRAR